MKTAFLIYPSLEIGDYMVSPVQEYRMERKPILGILYLGASLEKHGISVEISDQSVDGFIFKKLAERLSAGKPLFVGIYSDSILKPKAIRLIKFLKNTLPRVCFVIGGPACVEYKDFHKAGCDIVCHGEGESTICEIADFCLGKKALLNIKGISFLDDGKIVKNEPRSLIEDLDTLPFPCREKTKINEYYDYHIFGMKQPYTTMITSRGCAYRCSFCASHGFWDSKVRFRSPANVVDEIEECVRKYKIRYIGFKDDIFCMKMDWTYDFVEEMKKRNLKVSFSCMLHPYSFRGKRHEMLTLLKEVGLDIIIPGLQSVDEKVLKAIQRHPDEPHYLAELITEAKKLSITTVMEFIFGLPGDSPEIFRKNFRYALKVKPHYALFYSLSKLPGTEISRQYSNSNVTEFSEEYIKEQTREYQKRFFLNPGILLQNSFHILTKNPGWIFKAGRSLPYILQATGVTK